MDPHDSRVVTEYSATQGSSNFSDQHFSGMDTTRLLFVLKQGPRSLENHIREFLAFAHYSDLPDIILIEIFCDGINQPLRSQLGRKGPRSSMSCFLDFVLLTVGSLFTVGVADEDRDTASMTEMLDAPECAHKMAATAEPVHKMAATTTPRHVSAASHESIQVKVDVKEQSQVTVDVKEPSKVSVDVNEPSQVTIDRHKSCHACSALGGSCSVCSALVGSCSVCSALVGSCSVCSALVLWPADSASAPSLSTSTWTWPSVPPPVPPPLHRHPGLYKSVWKPLLGGGAMSRILSMQFRSLTTRGHSFTTLTLTPHYCCHSPSNCISHHPLH